MEMVETKNQKSHLHPESSQSPLPPPPYTRDAIPFLDINKAHIRLEPLVDIEVPFSDLGVDYANQM